MLHFAILRRLCVNFWGEGRLEGPFQITIAVDKWSVYSDGAVGADCYLSGHLVQGEGLKRLVIVIVYCLEEVLMVGEDSDRIPAYVRL